jgi:hypothetical protein
MKKQYTDTRRWRCYEAALLMKKDEIRTDRQTGPLTTPKHASVLGALCLASRVLLNVARTRRCRNSFLGKEKKAKVFSFSIKRNLYSSCSRIYSSIVKSCHSYQEYT